ncbi:MAG: carbohydrate kinase family protein [Pyrinomonadaceae bacterium]|nr:carbohydrate kinase family protein [Pyrinomonadaceae bacterium]
MKFPFEIVENKEFDVVGFGENAVDYLIVVPEFPKFDTKMRLSNYSQMAGGQIASAITGMQRLGAKTAYAGRFGADKEGDFGIESLRVEGVETRFCKQIDGARTRIAFILIDEKTGERTVLWNRDEELAYTIENTPLEPARLTKILHTDANDPHAFLELARIAKQNGALVSVDVDNVFDGLEKLLPLVDVLISSNDFPHQLTGIADEREALQEIQNRYGCALVGKTKGVRGGLVYVDGVFLSAKAYEVPGGCKDTTGAGDAFHAGFLYGLLTGEEVETSLKIANAVAALKCRELGARTDLPNHAELDLILKR